MDKRPKVKYNNPEQLPGTPYPADTVAALFRGI